MTKPSRHRLPRLPKPWPSDAVEPDPNAAAPQHLLHLIPCPHLPPAAEPLTAACLHAAGTERGEAFYLKALEYAQSLWQQGFPARALLLINRALGCALDAGDTVLNRWPLPYRAVVWLLQHHEPGQFIGNPRRHWQHLATRMVEPRRELRTWRAWACWQLARVLLPHLPADELQLSREPVTEPTADLIHERLTALGHPGEAALWRETLDFCQSARTIPAPCSAT